MVAVRVHPGARRATVGRAADGSLRVAVTAPAVDGKANDALVAVLAEAFGVRRRDVTVLSGERARHKRVRIVGAAPDALEGIEATSGP